MRSSVLETIGSPLVEVTGPPGTTIAAKLEGFNPGGSAKDRPAREMVRAAEREGALSPDGVVVEATSGNTGIGLAMVCAALDYDLVIVMPAAKSVERRRLMRAYGAEIELVDGDIQAAIDRANTIASARGGVRVDQFANEANVAAHYRTTGPELLEETAGDGIDAFVATIGTGGTFTGVGRRLLETENDVELVAVEPANNAVLSGEEPGDDAFQGMGPGFVSDILDQSLIDEIETVELAAAEAECRRLAREEGILVGQSSGAAMIAARRVATRLAPDTDAERGDAPTRGASGNGVLVTTVFPDSGERYLSAGTFD